MPHLGADVAAYVDGQLSGAAARDAATHLEMCDACEKAVRQQRLLKSRMSTVATPEPPAALLASLASLAADPPARDSWWVRMGRSAPLRAGVVLVGASLAVVATAYAVGGPSSRGADEVSPAYVSYVAGFDGPAAGFGGGATAAGFGATPSGTGDTVITAAAMDDLNEFGWACHDTLAGDLHRVSGAYTDGGEVILLTYSDGRSRLDLYEQTGAIDPSTLDGFRPETMAGSQVWVRPGTPVVVTWDDGGTVFTIVTDVERARVERAVAELPTASRSRDGVRERIGDGLDRMAGWIGAA